MVKKFENDYRILGTFGADPKKNGKVHAMFADTKHTCRMKIMSSEKPAKIAVLAADMVDSELQYTLDFFSKNAGLILEQIEEVQGKNTGGSRLMSARKSPL